MSPMKAGPTFDAENECTDEMMPLRVRSVPKRTKENVVAMSTMFHTFSMPRFC